MANEIEKVNSIAIGDIEKISGRTDGNIEKLSGREFTGSTTYKVHTFTSDGELDVSSGGSIDFLVVGGGGGGGDHQSEYAGGGGAGGMISSALTSSGDSVSHGPWTIAAGVYTIQVGAGGAGGPSNGDGGNGGNGSYIKGKTGETFTNYICAVYGGGGGGSERGGSSGSSLGGAGGYNDGGVGASAGGASLDITANYGGGYIVRAASHGRDVSSPTASWPSDYFAPTDKLYTDAGYFGGGSIGSGTRAGGGGGAGGLGGKGGAVGVSGEGGAPRANSFRTGSAVYYAAGGPAYSGGVWHDNALTANGGLVASTTSNAAANSGYGGRGTTGGTAGGSGIVVIRYIDGAVSASGGTETTYSV